MVLLAVAAVVAGSYELSQGNERGFVGLAVALGAAAAIPWYLRPNKTADPSAAVVDGRAEPGLVFVYSTSRIRAATAAMAVLTAGMIALALWPETIATGMPLARPIGVVGAIFAGGMSTIGVANSRKGGSFALTPTGVFNGRAGYGSFVPWEVVDRVSRTEVKGTPLVALFVSDRDAIEVRGFARWLTRLDTGVYGDVTTSPWALRVDPDVLVAAIRHYLEHPADRRELGTHRAVERFRAIARPAPAPVSVRP